jgi:hypothetical protein
MNSRCSGKSKAKRKDLVTEWMSGDPRGSQDTMVKREEILSLLEIESGHSYLPVILLIDLSHLNNNSNNNNNNNSCNN